MGKLDDAEKYYHRYLNQLSHNHPDIPNCYHALGRVTSEKNDYDSSLMWCNKSLEIFMRTLEPYHPNIAKSHNHIAIAHESKGDFARALESYEKALVIWKKVYCEDHCHIGVCFSNIGLVHMHEKKYTKALECHEKALIIFTSWVHHIITLVIVTNISVTMTKLWNIITCHSELK